MKKQNFLSLDDRGDLIGSFKIPSSLDDVNWSHSSKYLTNATRKQKKMKTTKRIYYNIFSTS